MTPEMVDGLEDPTRIPLVGGTVALMAVLAGATSYFGWNWALVGCCMVVAALATWYFLAPPVIALEPAPAPDHTAGSATGGVQRFAGGSVPVGAAATGAVVSGSTLPVAGPGPDATTVRPLGVMPPEAAALTVAPTVQPAATKTESHTLGPFEIRGASRQVFVGTQDDLVDTPRRDDFVIARTHDDRCAIAVLALGAPSAEHAHHGAAWASRLVARSIDHHMLTGQAGIDRMLDAARKDFSTIFAETFEVGARLRTAATTLLGIIAPTDGGPIAGFRLGDGDILVHDGSGWSSVFEQSPGANETVFPRDIDAEVASIGSLAGPLVMAGKSVHWPVTNVASVAATFAEGLAGPVTSGVLNSMLDFDSARAERDRSAVVLWRRGPAG